MARSVKPVSVAKRSAPTARRTLSKRCEHAFGHAVRAAGSRYFRARHVSDSAFVDGELKAQVLGAERTDYVVTVRGVDEHTLRLECSCLQSRALTPCPHMWALLLAVYDGERQLIGTGTGDLDVVIGKGEREITISADREQCDHRDSADSRDPHDPRDPRTQSLPQSPNSGAPNSNSSAGQPNHRQPDVAVLDPGEPSNVDVQGNDLTGFATEVWTIVERVLEASATLVEPTDKGLPNPAGRARQQGEPSVLYEQRRLADDDRFVVQHRELNQSLTPYPTTLWEQAIEQMEHHARTSLRWIPPALPRPAARKARLEYCIYTQQALVEWLPLSFRMRQVRKDGSLGMATSAALSAGGDEWVDDADRKLLRLLLGGRPQQHSFSWYGIVCSASRNVELAPQLFDAVLPELCATGRLGWLEPTEQDDEIFHPLRWDGDRRCDLELELAATTSGGLHAQTVARRGDERIDLSSAVVICSSGVVVLSDRLIQLQSAVNRMFLERMWTSGEIVFPPVALGSFAQKLSRIRPWPQLRLDETIGLRVQTGSPGRQIQFFEPDLPSRRTVPMRGRVSFRYAGQWVHWRDPRTGLYLADKQTLLLRDEQAERSAFDELATVGLTTVPYTAQNEADVQLPASAFVSAVRALLDAGWQIEAEGQRLRTTNSWSVFVSSGIDWFDLEMEADFGGVRARLPELVAALDHARGFVQLSDGSQGLLPETWLARYAPLATLGRRHEQALRFAHSQAALLDALLAQQPDANVDEQFDRIRRELGKFTKVRARRARRGF